ncbi:hypothetical protein ABVT39_000393 [Epinephelus coioides]
MSDTTDEPNLAEHGNRSVQVTRNQIELTQSVQKGQRGAGMSKQCLTDTGNRRPG